MHSRLPVLIGRLRMCQKSDLITLIFLVSAVCQYGFFISFVVLAKNVLLRKLVRVSLKTVIYFIIVAVFKSSLP